MKEASQTFDQMTLWDIPSVTSSLEAASGALPCAKPDGQMIGQSGQAPARVPASVRQAKAKGLQTLVTSGLLGHDSSASADLQSSLENKLVPRLDTAGSTLFRLIWKHKTTPLGRSYLERQALAHRTSGNGFTSWPSPQTHDDKLRGNTAADNHYFPHDLSNAALIASWPTPNGDDANNKTRKSGEFQSLTRTSMLAAWSTPRCEDSECAGAHRGKPDTLHSQANLAAWASPSARDWKDTSGMAQTGINPDGSKRTRLDQLPRQANLAGWPTPCTPNGGRSMSTEVMDATGKTLDGKKHMAALEQAVKFAGPVRLTAFGAMLTGSDAGMESSGQLNPAHSRWLMGVPPVWDGFASTAMQSVSLRRKHSLKRISKQQA